jgi:hypothetical protein
MNAAGKISQVKKIDILLYFSKVDNIQLSNHTTDFQRNQLSFSFSFGITDINSALLN